MLIKLQKYNVIFLTDTTLIQNKLGIDNTGYTPQLLKHKTSKISLIIDDIGIPIIATIFSGNTNDNF